MAETRFWDPGSELQKGLATSVFTDTGSYNDKDHGECASTGICLASFSTLFHVIVGHRGNWCGGPWCVERTPQLLSHLNITTTLQGRGFLSMSQMRKLSSEK
jgi:hypothetical protein